MWPTSRFSFCIAKRLRKLRLGRVAILAEAGFDSSPEAKRNLGILYQESGRQQQALDIFFEQLKTPAICRANSPLLNRPEY
jgi:hypothetical protein